ncbi:MAG: hypothetical protein CVT81_04510 [Alphaproteobacteria bacterium HGW-Alphaproteobacteria-3]|nr:MAG: hypothetical protein CVT81_04510 [Alphaproteobacteria bacterium HGW-Alphaproteobacteria-3]
MNRPERSRTFLPRAICLALLFPFIAACAGDPPALASPASVSFEARPALRLDIASVAVDSRFHSSGREPYVEHLHKVTPSAVARSWADARLVASGNRGTAVLTVFDGTVTQERLEKKGGLTGLFGDQLDTRLKARLKARLTVERPAPDGGSGTWSAEVDVTAERTVLESASLNERDAAYTALMQALAAKFDAGMSMEVERSMESVLR